MEPEVGVLEERKERLFEMGRVVVTRAVMGKMVADERFAGLVFRSLERHARGDWGNVVDSDKIENELSLDHGERLFSAYEDPEKKHPRVWIVTERDRSTTTILFAEEY